MFPTCAFSYTGEQECQERKWQNSFSDIYTAMRGPLSGTQGRGCGRQPCSEPCCRHHLSILSPLSFPLLCLTVRSQVSGTLTEMLRKDHQQKLQNFFCFGLGAVDGWHKRLAQLIAKQQQMGYRAELKKPDHLCLWPSCGNVRPFQAYAECCLGSTWGKSQDMLEK